MQNVKTCKRCKNVECEIVNWSLEDWENIHACLIEANKLVDFEKTQWNIYFICNSDCKHCDIVKGVAAITEAMVLTFYGGMDHPPLLKFNTYRCRDIQLDLITTYYPNIKLIHKKILCVGTETRKISRVIDLGLGLVFLGYAVP